MPVTHNFNDATKFLSKYKGLGRILEQAATKFAQDYYEEPLHAIVDNFDESYPVETITTRSATKLVVHTDIGERETVTPIGTPRYYTATILFR
jgi:hypothetical protein